MPALRLTFGHDANPSRTIVLAQGDITRETTEAIVNAANSSLLGGGGVDGAIHRAGGPAILEACKRIRQTQYASGLPSGQAVATTGGQLAAKYVIHTVGPIWRGGDQGEAGLLASAYRESIRVADELRLTSLAFPAISTGAYGYPLDAAAEVAVQTVVKQLAAAQHVRLIKLVVFDSTTFSLYSKKLEALVESHPDYRLDRFADNEKETNRR
jgi:O-acetyl-ADP-ribose deacetylase (regulator of RNase III)